MGVNTTGSAMRNPTFVAVVRSSATLQEMYDTAMHSAAGSQSPRRAPRSPRTMRGPNSTANTADASPKRMASAQRGEMLS